VIELILIPSFPSGNPRIYRFSPWRCRRKIIYFGQHSPTCHPMYSPNASADAIIYFSAKARKNFPFCIPEPTESQGHSKKVTRQGYRLPEPKMISCTCCGKTNVWPRPTQCIASNRVSPSFIRGKLGLWVRSTRSHESTRCLPLTARSAFGACTRRSMVKLETVAKPIRDPTTINRLDLRIVCNR